MTDNKVLPILVFAALPASGKSESRRYLKSLDKEGNAKFHLGDTSVQVDDYPYVDGMKKIDVFAEQVFGKGKTIFFNPTTTLFLTDWDWGTLTYMINDDYFDILKCKSKIPSQFEKDPVEWLFNKYDVASVKTGHITARFFNLHKEVGEEKWKEFKEACFKLCQTILHDKYANIPESLEGKTVVFEFSRGGEKGKTFPLGDPYGYEYSLPLFDKYILENAAILYIWVTPEQSHQKNRQRAKEGMEGKSQTVSTQLSLNHGVSETVMDHDYGTDDFDYLISKSPNKNYLPIIKDDEEIHVKAGRLDNREDLTSDFRKPQKDWTKEQLDKMSAAMTKAFDSLLGK